MKRFSLLVLAFIAFGVATSSAQNVAVKTNLLHDATQSINLGVEIGVSERWTIDLSGNYNSWSKDSAVKWKHIYIQPEARYWFCDRFAGHFVGGHLIYGAFNFGNLNNNISFLGTDLSPLSKYRYQGFGYGIGIAYGYAFLLSEHLNLELEMGVGYILADYQQYECDSCGRYIGSGLHNYFGPTKLAVNFVYCF